MLLLISLVNCEPKRTFSLFEHHHYRLRFIFSITYNCENLLYQLRKKKIGFPFHFHTKSYMTLSVFYLFICYDVDISLRRQLSVYSFFYDLSLNTDVF